MKTTGEITWLSSFSTTGLIESGPADLATFSFDRSLATSTGEISKSSIVGYVQFMLSGRRFIREVVPLRILLCHSLARSSGDLIEKTDWNCADCITLPKNSHAL